MSIDHAAMIGLVDYTYKDGALPCSQWDALYVQVSPWCVCCLDGGHIRWTRRLEALQCPRSDDLWHGAACKPCIWPRRQLSDLVEDCARNSDHFGYQDLPDCVLSRLLGSKSSGRQPLWVPRFTRLCPESSTWLDIRGCLLYHALLRIIMLKPL